MKRRTLVQSNTDRHSAAPAGGQQPLTSTQSSRWASPVSSDTNLDLLRTTSTLAAASAHSTQNPR